MEASTDIDKWELDRLSIEQMEILVNMLDNQKGNPSEGMTSKKSRIIYAEVLNNMIENLRLL